MTTIPDTVRIIAHDVQCAAEELIRLLLRKTIRPSINPICPNARVIYNPYTCRYERGVLGCTADDNVNKYNFSLTYESLGWTDDVFINFKTTAKAIRGTDAVMRFPASGAKNRLNCVARARVAFNDRETRHNQLTGRCSTPSPHNPSDSIIKSSCGRKPHHSPYKNLIDFISNRSIRTVIGNKSSASVFIADVPYTQTFKIFESIGQDIIDQTDPSICPDDSALMSTSLLRAKLYTLEQNLALMSVRQPDLFTAYIELLKIINSIPRTQMDWVINLIAALTFQRWEELSCSQQRTFLDVLGDEFVNAFVSNQLIGILLQSDSELILTSAYLYPLLKMLFAVFNYSKLTPNVIDTSCERMADETKAKMRKYFEKRRGAYYRRGDPREIPKGGKHVSIRLPPGVNLDLANIDSDRLSAFIDERTGQPFEYPMDLDQEEIDPDCMPPEPEPADVYTYEFIKLFGELYPTLIGLMGGTEEFPPDSIQIELGSVPANYDGLENLPGYLWRFNDYSYCCYVEYQSSRQLISSIGAKVCAKVRYLQSI